jgi:hypothetical protein
VSHQQGDRSGKDPCSLTPVESPSQNDLGRGGSKTRAGPGKVGTGTQGCQVKRTPYGYHLWPGVQGWNETTRPFYLPSVSGSVLHALCPRAEGRSKAIAVFRLAGDNVES